MISAFCLVACPPHSLVYVFNDHECSRNSEPNWPWGAEMNPDTPRIFAPETNYRSFRWCIDVLVPRFHRPTMLLTPLTAPYLPLSTPSSCIMSTQPAWYTSSRKTAWYASSRKTAWCTSAMMMVAVVIVSRILLGPSGGPLNCILALLVPLFQILNKSDFPGSHTAPTLRCNNRKLEYHLVG
jgi:hypothetical protein